MVDSVDHRTGPAVTPDDDYDHGNVEGSEQAAIVDRYPELRGCLTDQIIFPENGQQTAPMSELKLPVTLAEADAVVARLRQMVVQQQTTRRETITYGTVIYLTSYLMIIDFSNNAVSFTCLNCRVP